MIITGKVSDGRVISDNIGGDFYTIFDGDHFRLPVYYKDSGEALFSFRLMMTNLRMHNPGIDMIESCALYRLDTSESGSYDLTFICDSTFKTTEEKSHE